MITQFFNPLPQQQIVLPWILTLLLLLTAPATVHAQFRYTTNNGTITITGYTGPGGAVVIPSSTNGYPVTSIGTAAFQFISSITSVTIPNSIASIGTQAFRRCSGLTDISIPEGVTSIGDQACFECPRLTSITIPGTVTNIGTYAFAGCQSLDAITVSMANVLDM